MSNILPKRKPLRMKKYDYSAAGAYFVTICTKERKMLFSPIGATSLSAKMIERVFNQIISEYEGVNSPIYVVMPNHFHAIITISRSNNKSPTLSDIVQSFKRSTTAEYAKMVKDGIVPPFNKQIWQRSFYDHIIRNNDDYEEVYKYIYENPTNWKYDKLYSEND